MIPRRSATRHTGWCGLSEEATSSTRGLRSTRGWVGGWEGVAFGPYIVGGAREGERERPRTMQVSGRES